MKKRNYEAFTNQIIQFKVNYPEYFQIQTYKPGIFFFRPWSKYCVYFTLFRLDHGLVFWWIYIT